MQQKHRINLINAQIMYGFDEIDNMQRNLELNLNLNLLMLGYVSLHHSFPSKKLCEFFSHLQRNSNAQDVFPLLENVHHYNAMWFTDIYEIHFIIYFVPWAYLLLCVSLCFFSTFDRMRLEQLSFLFGKNKNSILLHIRFAQQIVYSILVALAWRHWNQIFVTAYRSSQFRFYDYGG